MLSYLIYLDFSILSFVLKFYLWHRTQQYANIPRTLQHISKAHSISLCFYLYKARIGEDLFCKIRYYLIKLQFSSVWTLQFVHNIGFHIIALSAIIWNVQGVVQILILGSSTRANSSECWSKEETKLVFRNGYQGRTKVECGSYRPE